MWGYDRVLYDWAASLRWFPLWMKRGLFGLQIGNEFLSSIDRLLIGDRALDFPVPLDRLVDFSALLTHPTSQPSSSMTNR